MDNSIFLNGAASPSSQPGYCMVKTGTQTFPIEAPNKVRDIRRKASVMSPISNDAQCRRNNEVLSEEDTVYPNETVVFIRQVGEKGI